MRNLIKISDAGFTSPDNLQEKCKVCGRRQGLHYPQEYPGYIMCPITKRLSLKERIANLEV